MTDKNTFFQQKLTLNVRGRLMDLTVPKVMGILNLTPDSFYDGGRSNSETAALKQAEQMLADGADIIDIGSYSSRPQAEHISTEEELDRMIPVLKSLVREFPEAIFSIDTFRAAVAEEAILSGAHIINDISGGQLDPEIFGTVARLKVPYILMHMKGNPQTMAQQNDYNDVFCDIFDYFTVRISRLRELDVRDIIIDPGFGFAKTLDQNYELLARLEEFKFLECPILAGLSRKSMIYKLLGISAEEALNGTSVCNTMALLNGASILRVHDVKPAVEAVKLTEKFKSSQ